MPDEHVSVEQLLREWPPGYGGVERVAHELASFWGGVVYSLDVQRQGFIGKDPLPVAYPRRRLPRAKAFDRLQVPLPSRALWRLLRSSNPLHGHLPSPGVLLVLVLARLLRRRRKVTAHWHCFLEPGHGVNGRLFALYQWLALRLVPWLSAVITTSPILAQELQRCGCAPHRVFVLPCCLSPEQEHAALSLHYRHRMVGSPLQVLFIGRLDSYKRLDWLLQALARVQASWHLVVVGEGPRRLRFEALAVQLLGKQAFDCVSFLGRLSEADKLAQLEAADVLVLPSDCSNEAFGIVQLEAMASGIPALAFRCDRSGMGWVGQLSGFDWPQTPEALPGVLQRLAEDRSLCLRLGQHARERYSSVFARTVWLQKLSSWQQR